MNKKTKMRLITAALLVLVGCLIFGGIMSMLKWDFSKLSTVKYETNEYDIIEPFSNISIETDTADIIFELSGNGKYRVECYEETKAKHSVTVKDDTLVIGKVNKKAWYDYIGINFGSQKIKVYLPEKEYAALLINESTGDVEIPGALKFESAEICLSTGDVDFLAPVSGKVKIKTSTGNIYTENTSAGELDLTATTGRITALNVICNGDINVKVSTGKTFLTDIDCKNLTSSGSTGDISLSNVLAREKISVKRSTGDVKFDRTDAAEIFVKTGTGGVTGTLLTDKIFITETSTGKIRVPASSSGGKCEIKTSTGNIKIEISKNFLA